MVDILIIDDDRDICTTMAHLIRKRGYEAEFALTLTDGLRMISAAPYDVVFLDVRLLDGNGLNAIQDIRTGVSPPEVVIITGEGDPDGAELAIRYGAWDYIEKPLSVESVTLPIMRALQYRDEKSNTGKTIVLKRGDIVGNSPQIERSLVEVSRVARNQVNVLIEGETGTGKELFARAVHQNSTRSRENFVVVDCAALPQNLVESVLFGHAKGAFTGADQSREGLVKQADGGTLFLDEIGELSLSIQKTFLRVLQEKCFRPVGRSTEVQSDFRMIAASNRDLDEMVQQGRFRQDLLFRIRSVVISLPPLRERKVDIKQLAMHFISQYCDQHQTLLKGFSTDFIEALDDYDWPGNVRELENSILSILSEAGEDPVLYPKHLPNYIRVNIAKKTLTENKRKFRGSTPTASGLDHMDTFKNIRTQALDNAEKQYLKKLIELARWDIKEACRVSNLSRPRLYALLKKHNITRVHPSDAQ